MCEPQTNAAATTIAGSAEGKPAYLDMRRPVATGVLPQNSFRVRFDEDGFEDRDHNRTD